MKSIILTILPYIVALLIGATGSWVWQANSYGKIIADSNASHQADLTAIANVGAAQARQALEKQQAAEQALADLDQKAQKEKTDGLAENEKWRRAAADSTRRLPSREVVVPVAARCLASPAPPAWAMEPPSNSLRMLDQLFSISAPGSLLTKQP